MSELPPFRTAALFLIFVGWLAILLSGCGGPDVSPPEFCAGSPAIGMPGPIQASEAKIINGELSTDRRGTVYVLNSEGFCSGTVIGPHTVLSAAHCVGLNQTVEVIKGVTGKLQAEAVPHPDYVLYPYDDIALFHVAEVLPEPYIELYDHTTRATECTGFVAQGYGKGSGGQLHEKPYLVRDVGWRTLTTVGDDGSTCFGDSGGPLYAIVDGVPYLAGSLSTGFDSACMTGGHHVRLDYYTDWIMENVR